MSTNRSTGARRLLGTPAAILILGGGLLGLTACGSEVSARPTDIDGPSGFDAVEISGDQGTAPTVTWNGQMEAGKLEVQTLVTGDGDPVAEGDTVLTNLWVGNGFSKTGSIARMTSSSGMKRWPSGSCTKRGSSPGS